MRYLFIRNLIIASFFAFLISMSVFATEMNPSFKLAATEGSVTFEFTSVENGEGFSPRHILAVWIEKEDGTFVKSLKVNADKRIEYLYSWNTKSSGNITDATTGATLASHQTHNVTWDLTDVQGIVVEDGNYKIRIEYTSEHAQGPLFSVSFLKGIDPVSTNPSEVTYFKDISLIYTPESTTGLDNQATGKVKVYPVPTSDKLIFYRAKGYFFNIYNHIGKLKMTIPTIPSDYFEVDLSEIFTGSYILVGNKGDETYRQIIQVIE